MKLSQALPIAEGIKSRLSPYCSRKETSEMPTFIVTQEWRYTAEFIINASTADVACDMADNDPSISPTRFTPGEPVKTTARESQQQPQPQQQPAKDA